MKKTISFFLAVVLLVSVFAVGGSAFDEKKLTQSQWNTLYESLCDENTLPTLCVGRDETELNLVWHADKTTASAQVRLSKNSDMSDFVTYSGKTDAAETESQLVCRVTLTEIEPNTAYFYQWNTGNGWSEICRYDSKGTNSYKMLVVGDIQIGGQNDSREYQSAVGFNWNNTLAEALTENDDIAFLLSPGDNTSTGVTADEWQTLLMPASLRSLPMALAIGNHDKKGFSYNYYTNMPNEYYGKYFEGLDRDFWFRYGDVLYLFFDGTSSCAADHMAMAKKAVAENSDAKWRVAVVHQALFGPGYSMLDAETSLLLNAVFTPIFDSFDVDLVLTGHSHLQGRSHFMYESSIVGKAVSGKTYKNPKGIIYLNSNTMSGTESFSLDKATPYIAYEFAENDVATYSTLEFEGDTMEIKTFRGDNSKLLDSLTIEKTAEHRDNSPLKLLHRFAYRFVEVCGRLYQVIDNIVVSIRGGHY